jgi:hypothetical protein
LTEFNAYLHSDGLRTGHVTDARHFSRRRILDFATLLCGFVCVPRAAVLGAVGSVQFLADVVVVLLRRGDLLHLLQGHAAAVHGAHRQLLDGRGKSGAEHHAHPTLPRAFSKNDR